jgi:glycosyltransferase involved in cell wall biosynthesis
VTTPARILYLHTTSEIGGSDVSLLRLVERLDRSRFAPTVVMPASGPLVARLEASGAAVIVMPSLWKLTSRRGRLFLAAFAAHYPLAVAELARLIRRERIALVHTNTIHNLYGGAAARRARVPHVWHIREIVWQSGALRRLELALVRRWSTRIIVTSGAVAAMFDGPAGRPPQMVTISNGIETDRFRPGEGDRVRRELGVGPDQTLVGTACRLDMWKGVDVFLDAAAIVARAHPSVHFAVVGGPIIGQEAYAGQLKQRAAAAGLGGRVHFTDWRYLPQDMPDVHRALDIFVLASSEPEPFGLVVIEAMATAKPVVATDRGGPAEIVEEGRTGCLVPPRDPPAMAAALARLVADPAGARAMGEAGRRRVEALYSVDRYIAGIERVYDEILSERAS